MCEGRSQLSLEDRIRKLTEDIIACKNDGQTAVLAEELREAIRIRVVHLRAKSGLIPLGPCSPRGEQS